MADISTVTLSLPAAIGMTITALGLAVGSVLWLTREIRAVREHVDRQLRCELDERHKIDKRVSRLEERADWLRQTPHRAAR